MFGHLPFDFVWRKKPKNTVVTPTSQMIAGELWTSIESGETKTIAQWKSGYTLSQNNDGTLTAQLKFSGGIPDLTLRRVN